jgi:CheW-like domain
MSVPELAPPSATPAFAPDGMSTRIGLRLHAAMPWLVLPGGLAAQLALDGRLAPLPNVKAWLLGVMNLRGNLVPVFDVGLAMGYAALPRGAPVLVIAPGPTAMAVACCEPPQLLEVGPAQAAAADDPMSAWTACCLPSALGRVYEFDPRAWLRRIGAQVPGRHAG